MSRRAVAGALLAAGLLGGCAALPPGLLCRPGEHRAEVLDLYFGRNIGSALGVSDEDFRRFLAEEVTPRFPDGLTVLDAAGQWRGQGGLVREPSKVVRIVLSGRPGETEKAQAIAAAYKARFNQQSVMTLRTPVCVSF